MKKMVIVLALVAAAFSAKAACVDWGMTTTKSSDDGATVYLLTGIDSSWTSAEDLIAAAVGSGTVKSAGRGTYAVPKTTSENAKITPSADFYFAIVADDGKSYNYLQAVGLGEKVYDPSAQEASKGIYNSITVNGLREGTKGVFGGIEPTPIDPTPGVPEPTSGLLLLVGGAALALRRKQK